MHRCRGWLATAASLMLRLSAIHHPRTLAPQMKEWLMEHADEAEVWKLNQKKAKKADYEALMRKALGQ